VFLPYFSLLFFGLLRWRELSMEIGRGDYPHLLEWHSSHCVALADLCATPHVKKILRLLAVDLALEAQALRREMRMTAQDVMVGLGKSRSCTSS
jgi:hypothetical protein